MRSTVQTFDLLSIGAALWEKKPERKRDLWKVAVRKIAIGYLARKAGFYTIYNLHFKNK